MQLNYWRGGAGEPLVLIHGIGSRWQVWQPVLERLARERDVIALDLPGFGDHPRMPPSGTPPGTSSLTTLVSDFLNELGVAAPHAAGNSLGGWISLELAKRGQASSATALSPAGFHNTREAHYQRLLLLATHLGAKLISPVADAVCATTVGRAAAVGVYVARPSRISPADAAASIRALAGAPWFTPTMDAILAETFTGGERIDVPVTIAWGQHDHVLLPRQAARAARALPRAQMLTLHGCGHVPTYDDPEQVARVILEGSRT